MTLAEPLISFDGFDWDAGNSHKCQKHGITLREIEEALTTITLIVDDPFPGERRYRTVGRTMAGRHVFAVFTWRGSKLRPISARFMHEREVASYEEAMAAASKR